MSAQFYNALVEILTNKQMSISSIARELKKSGYDQHRLILTGYLRALHDMGYLKEVDIPPSKVYTFKDEAPRDIYSIMKRHLEHVDVSDHMEIAVFILSCLFRRPCFKYELEISGIEAQKKDNILEIRASNLQEYRESIMRIKIPPEDPAYEIVEMNNDVLMKGNKVLLDIISELVSLNGLKAKYQQTKLA